MSAKSVQIISFYYPAVHIGGAQLLFARLAKSLAEHGFKIRVYENKECYITMYLKKSNIVFDIVNSKFESRFRPTDNELFIFSLSYVSSIESLFSFKLSNRFIFWDLHPNCLIEQLAFSGFYKRLQNLELSSILISVFEKNRKRKLIEFINQGIEYNGVLFMSQYNSFVHQSLFKLPKLPKLLSIPVGDRYLAVSQKTDLNYTNGILRIGWISRIDKEKTQILSLLVQDVALKNDDSIQLVIIGDGSHLEHVKKEVIQYRLKNVKFVGSINSEDLPTFLKNNIDLGFAMGTSALEFGMVKIPTVLVPIPTEDSFFKKENKRYSWLHKSVGFEVNTYRAKDFANITFETVLSDYKQNKEAFGNMSYQYVEKTHSLNIISHKLMSIIESNRFTFKELKRLNLNENSGLSRTLFKMKHAYKKMF